MPILALAERIEMSPLAEALRDSAYAYPVIEGTHVLSLALSVGTILWFDLRLLGLVFPGESIRALYTSLRPWLFLGFLLMLTTGVLLFAMRPAHILQNTYFQVKMGLLVVCFLNVLAYHFLVERSSSSWDVATPPLAARVAGALSLLLWFAVIAIGRLMAYSL